MLLEQSIAPYVNLQIEFNGWLDRTHFVEIRTGVDAPVCTYGYYAITEQKIISFQG
jgi:hypothetical protein